MSDLVMIASGALTYTHNGTEHRAHYKFANRRSNTWLPFVIGDRWYAIFKCADGTAFIGSFYSRHEKNDAPRYFPSVEAAHVYLKLLS